MEGKLCIFSGPSGAGKSTLVRHLLGLDLGLAFSISATSRRPRKGEKHGREYYFITLEEFQAKINCDEFIEWEEVYPGRYYGTLKCELDRIWEKGQHAIFDIDVQGGLNLKKGFGQNALSMFVMPPSLQVLEERLRARGTDQPDSLRRRLEKAEWEMRYAPYFDKILVNDQLDSALKEAESMVKNFLDQ
ncbi:MAG TPA: guanylate kinase [Bacteroides sp.]|nr:guanylate kinase [Bacteroides sp.]